MSTRTFVRSLFELFDANFNTMVMVRLIQVVFILGLSVVTGVAGLFLLSGLALAAISDQAMVKIFGPFGVALGAAGIFLLGALGVRLFCETFVVLFRVAENTASLVVQGARREQDEQDDELRGERLSA